VIEGRQPGYSAQQTILRAEFVAIGFVAHTVAELKYAEI
jgi:hypothetical protein